jgi:hypothetical protein
MKIRPVGVELLHADGQMDRHHEANCSFSKFFESAPKLLSVLYLYFVQLWWIKPFSQLYINIHDS